MIYTYTYTNKPSVSSFDLPLFHPAMSRFFLLPYRLKLCLMRYTVL